MKTFLSIFLSICFSIVSHSQEEIRIKLKVKSIFFTKTAYVIQAMDVASAKEYIIISDRIVDFKQYKKYETIDIDNTYDFLLKNYLNNAGPLNGYYLAFIYYGKIAPVKAVNLHGFFYIPLPDQPDETHPQHHTKQSLMWPLK